MDKTLTTTSKSGAESLQLEVAPATDVDIVAYLRRTHTLAEIAALAERDLLILDLCDRLDISVSDEELQIAGDTFRVKNKLLGSTETLAWLQQQRITVEDWSQGIRVKLLAQKLKEHLFGDTVDAHYLNNRNDYKRVALSQILVRDLADALKITQALRTENASFCALALEYSQTKISKEKGGFVGTLFVTELMPEIAQVIADAKEGEIVGPIQTKQGYHILKIEKWFAAELSELVRENILDILLQGWLKKEVEVGRQK